MSTILHVGNDLLHRIPVMRTANFAVFQSEDSVTGVRKAFARGDTFSAITFDFDIFAPSERVVSVARSLTAAPLVLFESALIDCDKSGFDFVVPAFTHPSLWLKKLHDVVEATHEQSERARRLRQECAAILSHFQSIRTESARVLVNPIDLEALWGRQEN